MVVGGLKSPAADSHPRLFVFLGSEFPIMKRRAKYNRGASGADAVQSSQSAAKSTWERALPTENEVPRDQPRRRRVWNPQDALSTRW